MYTYTYVCARIYTLAHTFISELVTCSCSSFPASVRAPDVFVFVYDIYLYIHIYVYIYTYT